MEELIRDIKENLWELTISLLNAREECDIFALKDIFDHFNNYYFNNQDIKFLLAASGNEDKFNTLAEKYAKMYVTIKKGQKLN